MHRIKALIRRYPRESLVTIVFFPFLYWATYQDMKASAPWYIITLVFIVGWFAGMTFMRRVVDPTFRYVDTKIAKLLGIKKV